VVRLAREALGRAEEQQRAARVTQLERLVAAFEADPTDAQKEAALRGALPTQSAGSYPAELRPVVRLAREALGRAEEQQRAARRDRFESCKPGRSGEPTRCWHVCGRRTGVRARWRR